VGRWTALGFEVIALSMFDRPEREQFANVTVQSGRLRQTKSGRFLSAAPERGVSERAEAEKCHHPGFCFGDRGEDRQVRGVVGESEASEVAFARGQRLSELDDLVPGRERPKIEGVPIEEGLSGS
jgi:hypothetical protein